MSAGADPAPAAAPGRLILRSSLIGPPAAVRDRIRLCSEAGVTTLPPSPSGDMASDRLDQLGQALDLIRQEAGSVPVGSPALGIADPGEPVVLDLMADHERADAVMVREIVDFAARDPSADTS